MVDCGMIDGKRVRYAFRTKEEAEGKAALLRAQRKGEGEDAFALAKFDRTDAEAALEVLKPHGLTLLEAAKFYVQNISLVRDSKSVRAVVDELLKLKAQDGRSKRYLKDLRLKLSNGFAALFGTRPIHEITHQELDNWLRSHDDWLAVTRNNYATALGVLFGLAAKRGYLLKDPTEQLDRANVQLEKPGILSLDEARALLAAAPADFVSAIALGLFAGLRPEAELWHLDWRGIDLKEKLIDISTSKNSASHRFVKIAPNLLAWLKAYKRDSGPVSPKGDAYHGRLQKARAAAAQELDRANLPHASLDDWPQDAMRHTFASMHYAAFKHAAETAEQMGHSNGLRIFFRHYRNRVKPAEAALFWRLVPERSVERAPAN
jgi:site-specific recombinase XerD